MRLDTFLLADAATAAPDGKLYIHGGGLTVIRAPVVPLSVPLSVAVRLQIEEGELQKPHEIVVSITGPDGSSLWPAQPLRFGPVDEVDHLLSPGEERYIQLAFSFGALTFATLGVYTVALQIDGEMLRQMTVPVVEGRQPSPQRPQAPPNRAARRRKGQ